jgi:hypothetical protein
MSGMQMDEGDARLWEPVIERTHLRATGKPLGPLIGFGRFIPIRVEAEALPATTPSCRRRSASTPFAVPTRGMDGGAFAHRDG